MFIDKPRKQVKFYMDLNICAGHMLRSNCRVPQFHIQTDLQKM